MAEATNVGDGVALYLTYEEAQLVHDVWWVSIQGDGEHRTMYDGIGIALGGHVKRREPGEHGVEIPYVKGLVTLDEMD